MPKDMAGLDLGQSGGHEDTRNRAAGVRQTRIPTALKGRRTSLPMREVAENTKALAGDDVLDTDNTAEDTVDNVGGPVNAVDPDPNTRTR